MDLDAKFHLQYYRTEIINCRNKLSSIMMKIIRILEVKSFKVTCEFSNGMIKELDVEPLVAQHKHLQGIQNLYLETNFAKVKIGVMGELLWEKIITINHNQPETYWDYDISPEFAYSHGKYYEPTLKLFTKSNV